MSKIKLTIDLKDGDSIAKAVKMLQAINGTTVTVETTETIEETTTEEEVEEKPKKKPRKPRQTQATETAEPETETEEEVEEEKPKETKGGKSDIGITEVRALLAEKVGNHRDLIKNKLTELGASSVTTLEESKYQDFFDFLNFL